MPLPPWPPQLSAEQLQDLELRAKTYALAHGLLYLPQNTDIQVAHVIPSSAIHAPFALFPTPFPRKLFERAKSLQQIYNVLYARVASDEAFLDRVLSAESAVGRVDEFVGQLWRIWKEAREEGFAQPLQLGIFRSDYLMHEEEDGLQIKQVEFNTISSSFGGLSQAVDGLHRYLMASTGYHQCSDILDERNVPPNNTLPDIVDGLAAAHATYLESSSSVGARSEVQILFVVQPHERNVFDQRFLEYELLKTHKIRIIRRTFDEIAAQADLGTASSRSLIIRGKGEGLPDVEISVVYFRAGYAPTDYPTQKEFETRKLLERSGAIKCPSIALQLAGSKKVQSVLSQQGVVESFLLSEHWDKISQDNPHVFPGPAIDDLRESWMEMWGLEDDGGIQKARENANNLVLKPQREGGGNNVYKSKIPRFLDSLPEEEREAWIAMALIKVPKNVKNRLIRSGAESVNSNVVSELGIFGWALFGYTGDEKDKRLSLKESSGGYLLRTKGEDSDEGGVAAGFSVLDSVILVD